MLNLPAAFAGLAQLASATLGAPFHAARVIDQAGAVYDDGGSIVVSGQTEYRDCVAQIDAATEAMRQADGYVDGDVRFIILSKTLIGDLSTDARVEVLDGPYVGTWLVSSIQRDPAGIGYTGRGRRA